jgi:membrane-associated phospholipid phosphatase
LIIIGVALFHILIYGLVNFVNSSRPSTQLWDLQTIVDDWLPYLSWTWVVYYFADLYVVFWGALVVWKLKEKRFVHAVGAYIGMIVLGAAIQIAFPAEAPWPDNLSPPQRIVHEFMLPYACMPSMHVALSVLPTCLGFAVLHSRCLKFFSASVAVLIAVSTLTMKEHYFIDALTGVILGLGFYSYWRRHAN